MCRVYTLSLLLNLYVIILVRIDAYVSSLGHIFMFFNKMLYVESYNARNRLFYIFGKYPLSRRFIKSQNLFQNRNRQFVSYSKDSILNYFNEKINRRLDINRENPIGVLTLMIKDYFTKHLSIPFKYISMDSLPVTIKENFDELQTPLDHISRDPRDTYYLSDEYIKKYEKLVSQEYIKAMNMNDRVDYDREFIDYLSRDLNHSTFELLPTHMTVYLPGLLRRGITGAIYSGQVFRRDEIDSQHYPIFHQIDGYLLFNLDSNNGNELLGNNERVNSIENDRIINHLKYTLEGLIDYISSHVDNNGLKLEKKWEDTTFPFTNPSLELYIKHEDKWVEILGCGRIKDVIIRNNFEKFQTINGGWAFGIGLERLAMVLCNITDIRQFWDNDERFFKQYKDSYANRILPKFQKYSKNPSITRDISFYIMDSNNTFNEDEMFKIIKSIGGNYVESINILSEYFHPVKQLKSLCYRIIYRGFENITNDFVNKIHKNIENELKNNFNIEIR